MKIKDLQNGEVFDVMDSEKVIFLQKGLKQKDVAWRGDVIANAKKGDKILVWDNDTDKWWLSEVV